MQRAHCAGFSFYSSSSSSSSNSVTGHPAEAPLKAAMRLGLEWRRKVSTNLTRMWRPHHSLNDLIVICPRSVPVSFSTPPPSHSHPIPSFPSFATLGLVRSCRWRSEGNSENWKRKSQSETDTHTHTHTYIHTYIHTLKKQMKRQTCGISLNDTCVRSKAMAILSSSMKEVPLTPLCLCKTERNRISWI